MKGTLVEFDGYTIYWIYIEEQNRIIRAKNLQIFKDIKIKKDIILPYYEKKLTF